MLDELAATVLGTLIALAIVRHRFRGRGATNMLVFLPMSTPEIVLGASLLTLFLNRACSCTGFATIFIAHVMFVVSYVVVTVKARLIDFDRHLEEAAMDLGANEWVDVPQDHAAAARARDPQRGAARVRALDRRLRDHLLRLRRDDHVPALRLGRRPRVGVPPQVNVIASAIFFVAVARHARQRALGAPLARRGRERSPRHPAPVPRPGSRDATVDLQRIAKEHLWMHFTRMGGYTQADVPIIVRGDGCYLEDANGKRYLDALAGLFSVNLGYGYGEEIGQAALEQMRELPFYTNWTYAHPRAIELAGEVASLAPGDLNRVFFVSGGSEAVESAWKLARQYYLARGEKRLLGGRRTSPSGDTTRSSAATRSPRRYKAITRHLAYHGTTLGALSLNGDPGDPDARSSRSSPRCATSRNTNRYHRPAGGDRGGVHRVPARRARADDRGDGPRDGVPRAHGAGAELRRRVHSARRATGRASARCATSTTSCSPPTR